MTSVPVRLRSAILVIRIAVVMISLCGRLRNGCFAGDWHSSLAHFTI
jgi:hypothetical protein